MQHLLYGNDRRAGRCFLLRRDPIGYLKRLNDADESIHVLACYLRHIIDQYPGEGQYIPPRQLDDVCGTLEYDVLSPAAQLCRYIVCNYMAELPASRIEFADIGMYVLPESDIEELLPESGSEIHSCRRICGDAEGNDADLFSFVSHVY